MISFNPPPMLGTELSEIMDSRTNAPRTKLSQSIITPGHITTSLIPLGRSSLRASTLGRHNNRTNSLGTKLFLEHWHLGDTTLGQTPLGRSSLRASTLGRHSNRTNSLGMKLSLTLFEPLYTRRQQYNQFLWDLHYGDNIRTNSLGTKLS